ncbi:MAG: T9SS type A sorting domain-containing protein [Sphingobacteriales bacterium]|nr:MAG: T9SS type A sorting domain-containing protein [Sphingobacteriales bacterium]
MLKLYKSFFFILLSLMPFFASAQTDTIALWTFENQSGQQLISPPLTVYGPLQPETGLGNLTSMHQGGAYAATFANAGNGTPKSLNINRWTTIGDYIQFAVNTVGKSSIKLSFEQGSASNNGPRDFKVSYSTDGITFTDLPNGAFEQSLSLNGSVPGAWSATSYMNGFSKTFNLPAALDNKTTAYIRLSTTSLNSVTTGTNVTTTGNSRFDNILVTGTASVPATLITNVATNQSAFCNATSHAVAVSFTTNATGTATYTAQLSDASGSFTTPVVIGTGTTTPISATIPAGTTAGNSYKIRVVEGTSVSQNTAGPITLNQSLSITQQPANLTICEGGIVNFEMQSPNTQTYQWLYNGNPVAINSFANSYTIPAALPLNAGNYSVALSNGACRDTTNNAVLTVNPGTMPAATTVSGSRFLGGNIYYPVIANDGSCGRLAMINALNNNLASTTVSVIAGAPQQSGTTGPWHVGRSFTVTPTNAPTGNVAISCYFSPQDFIAYNQSAPATQQITVNQTAQTLGNLYLSKLTNLADLGTGTVITPDSVSFQNDYWKVNITTNSFNNLATFYAHGNNFTPCPTPTISITESANTVCAGTTVNYTATITNQGASPAYQWQVNGANAGTGATYSYTPADGDTIRCVVTNIDCFSPVSDTSNTITMQITDTVTPGITITSDNNNTCAGTAITYTATATDTGTAPVYQWKVNGNNMGANATTFVYTPTNGDLVTCELTSNAICLTTTNPVVSNPITATVNDPVAATVTVTASPAGNATVGAPVVYTAAVSGTTSYNIDWYVNGQLAAQQQSPDNTYTRNAATVPDTVYAVLQVEGCFTDTAYTSNEVIVSTSTDIRELAVSLGLKCYPNPTTDNLTITLKQGSLKELQLINVLGQTVQTEAAVNSKQHVINLAKNAAGVYYVKVKLTHQGKEYLVVEQIIKN